MDKKITFRAAESKDINTWFEIKNKVWRVAYKDIFPEKVFENKEKNIDKKIENFKKEALNDNTKIAYVAENNNTIIGIMYGTLNSGYDFFKKDYADLVALYIYPEFQRYGIGSKFKEIFINWAKENNANKFVIGVLKDNIEARKVYEKWGGKLSNHEEDYIQLGKAYKEVFYTYNIK